MISASSLACRSPRASLRALAFAPFSPSISSPKRFSYSSKPTLFASSIKSVNLRPDRLSPICSLRSDRSFSSMDDASNSGARSVHDFAVKDAHGNYVELSKYKGKVLLIVNVASKCGLSNSNYPELTELYTKYKSQGLEILAFPCNQFGSKEPGTNNEILDFVCTRFKDEFPVFGKVDVNGDNAAPLYKFLKSSKCRILGDGIKWNFTKFLVDQNGNDVDHYTPTTSPSSIEASRWRKGSLLVKTKISKGIHHIQLKIDLC